MSGKRDYIIEIIQVGDYVKVSAVDPVSGIEACIVGAPSAGEAMLTRTAVRKLEYVMAKRDEGTANPSSNRSVVA